MDKEYDTPEKQQSVWLRHRAFVLMAIGLGAFVVYWANWPVAAVKTGYETIKSEPCECGMERLIDSRGVPYYYPTSADTVSGKHEWFYIEPSPNNHLPEDRDPLFLANRKGGSAMDP